MRSSCLAVMETVMVLRTAMDELCAVREFLTSHILVTATALLRFPPVSLCPNEQPTNGRFRVLQRVDSSLSDMSDTQPFFRQSLRLRDAKLRN
jgi:hypothetical protein